MDKPFAAYKGDDPFLFVCYAHEDQDVVYPEIAWLNEHEINIWYDEGISAGSNWRSVIGEALLNAHRVLFYISRHSLDSDHCNREINLALDENKAVVPVYLEEVTLTPDLKVGLNRVQALHHADSPSYRSQLIDALGTVSASEARTSPDIPSTPKPWIRRWHYAALAVFLLLAVSGAWVYNEYRELGNSFSVAVLPFKSMTHSDPEQVYGQAVAEDIRSALLEMQRSKVFDPNLGQIPLSVSATNTASLDGETDLADIGQDLGAAYLIQGNVEQTEGQIFVRAQLIHAASSTQVWSKLYTRSSDGEDTRTRIARNIAFVVDGEILFDIFPRISDISLTIFSGLNSTAMRHLLDAANQLRLLRSGEGGDWALAEQYAKQAIEADPDFAGAYALLANTYMNQRGEGRISLADASARAHAALSEAAARAEEPSNLLLEQLGQLLMYYDLDYAAAESQFRICRDQYPRDFVCHRGSAEIAFREGRIQDAYSFIETSLTLDAGSSERGLGQLLYSWYLLIDGQNQKALEAAQNATDLIHGGLLRVAALQTQMSALAYLGNREAIPALLEEAWALEGHRAPGKFAVYFLQAGQTDRAHQILNELDKPDPDAARAYIALGDLDAAFKALEVAVNEHDLSIYTSLRRAPWFEPLREDPRYDSLVNLMDSKEIHTTQYMSERDQ